MPQSKSNAVFWLLLLISQGERFFIASGGKLLQLGQSFAIAQRGNEARIRPAASYGMTLLLFSVLAQRRREYSGKRAHRAFARHRSHVPSFSNRQLENPTPADGVHGRGRVVQEKCAEVDEPYPLKGG
jgi:hypothetical protein